MIQEFEGKVIKAANKLKVKLSDSAEQLAVLSDSAEVSVPIDTSADVDLDQKPALISLEHCATWLSTLATCRTDGPIGRLAETLHVLCIDCFNHGVYSNKNQWN